MARNPKTTLGGYSVREVNTGTISSGVFLECILCKNNKPIFKFVDNGRGGVASISRLGKETDDNQVINDMRQLYTVLNLPPNGGYTDYTRNINTAVEGFVNLIVELAELESRGSKIVVAMRKEKVNVSYALVEFGVGWLFNGTGDENSTNATLFSLIQKAKETEDAFLQRLELTIKQQKPQYGNPISILMVDPSFAWQYTFEDYKALHSDL